ncbi:SDR family oxidoreductase [Streptomyces anulatus]|uniref:SDR family oxidoreductase n=1 Tax=Streptomyces anulatus TaxID=1892 RepID=UPI00340925AE
MASKWAVRGITKTAALELGRDRFRVNATHPGVIATPFITEPAVGSDTDLGFLLGRAVRHPPPWRARRHHPGPAFPHLRRSFLRHRLGVRHRRRAPAWTRPQVRSRLTSPRHPALRRSPSWTRLYARQSRSPPPRALASGSSTSPRPAAAPATPDGSSSSAVPPARPASAAAPPAVRRALLRRPPPPPGLHLPPEARHPRRPPGPGRSRHLPLTTSPPTRPRNPAASSRRSEGM